MNQEEKPPLHPEPVKLGRKRSSELDLRKWIGKRSTSPIPNPYEEVTPKQ